MLPRNAIASLFHWRILNQTHVVCSSLLQPLSGLTQYFDVHRTRPVPWLALVGHVGLLPSSFVGVALVSSHDPRALKPLKERSTESPDIKHRRMGPSALCHLSSCTNQSFRPFHLCFYNFLVQSILIPLQSFPLTLHLLSRRK